MPTVHTEDGFRFFFYSNEQGEPPHIHVERGDGTAKFWLDPVALADMRRMKPPELKRAREITEANHTAFMEAWNEHFGS